MTLRPFSIAVAATLALAPALAAQGWSVSVAAGRAVDDPVAARLPSTVASVGLEYADSADRWLYAEAGTPLASAAPAWGAAGVGTWLGIDRGAVTLGASVGLHGFGWGAADSVSSGIGGTVEVMPTLAVAGGALRAELASGFVGTMESAGGVTFHRGVSESSARLVATPAVGLELSGEGRFLHAVEGDFPYAGGAVTLDRPGYGAWAYAGSWLAADFPRPKAALGAGGSVSVKRTKLEVAVRQEPADPVYLSLPRRTWTVRLSRGFGRVPPAPARPATGLPPRYLPTVANGVAVFRLPRRDYPQAPSLVGDFSDWRPVAMAEDGPYWTARVDVAAGAHHYGFRAADGTFFLPPGVPAVDDGFGGRSAVLVVP